MAVDTAAQDKDVHCNDSQDLSPFSPRNGHLIHNFLLEAAPKPTVIGIYGISGSGKSFILDVLKQDLDPAEFIFFEGSEVIASLVPGGLTAFHALDEEEKSHSRTEAINFIKYKSYVSGKTAVVTGHLMFWSETDNAPKAVYTAEDLDTFTHIIYLHIPIEIISRRVAGDDERRVRTVVATEHLRQWQEAESFSLRHLCRQHGILFMAFSEATGLVSRVKHLVQYFRQSITAEDNIAMVRTQIDQILALPCHEGLETVLVLDGDKTLAPEDTGALFWQEFARNHPDLATYCPLKDLFSGPMGYSDAAFRQATLLYEEATDMVEFDTICQSVASSVTIYPEFVSLLRLVAGQKRVGAIVVTCGIAHVWNKVLERYGLSNTIKVIGGGRISDGFIVTPAVKASIVAHLQDTADLYVWAFGDSPLDIPMLQKADQAIVVVGNQDTRSSTMDSALAQAVNKGLQARQVLLPSRSPPRLDTKGLPLISLDDQELIYCIFSRLPLQILQATDKAAAKLLMAPMRDAAVAGPSLRKAHANVGRYLATEYISQLIGLEEYDIPHVQGHSTTGHRLRNEHRTSIVALMRGGEPMAFGINKVFPRAMFIHASCADDIKLRHVQGQATLILVDSVANSGKTLIEFIKRVSRLDAKVRIVVVVGVVQADAVAETHVFAKVMRRHGASMVALRVSKNKFTGTKTTDTGNRLFNTTHLV
ncbi:hypothetical protein ACHAQI_007429 [Fusarium lateritium]